MGNFNEYNAALDGAATPEQRELWSTVLEHQNRQAGTAHIPAGPSVRVASKSELTVDGKGNAASKSLGVAEATLATPLRPGHVFIPGFGETTIEAATNAGLIAPQGVPSSGFKSPVAQRSNVAAGTTTNSIVEAPSDSEDREDGEARPEAGTAEAALLAAREGAVDDASKTIQAIEQFHGAHVVDQGLSDASDSGYLPDADQLPQGVTMDHVSKIVAGYTASANDTLSGVGASVNMLMETLTEDELREARRATIMSDNVKMQHLGRQAVDRLAKLPNVDPETFAGMLEDMRPQERKALSQNSQGEWIVTVPGASAMSFGAAVRAGIVRV